MARPPYSSRLSFAPVDALAAGIEDPMLAEKCGVTTRTLRRWREIGVPWEVADLLACRLGWHPGALWGIEWEAAADAAVRRASEEGKIGAEVGTVQGVLL